MSSAAPGRLLGIVMPLTIVLGIVLALPLLTELEFWEAAIIAVTLAMAITVLMSVFAHGISAHPLIRRYGSSTESMDDDAPEMEKVPAPMTRR